MVALSISITGNFGLTWSHWKRFVTQIEALGFAGLFRSDHFTLPDPVDLDSLELIVSLTYLADHTERVHFGPLVAPLSFRDPVMLARQALALDDLSNGRMVLGLGTGYAEREHRMFGYHLGDVPTRYARLAEGLEIITRLLRNDTPISYTGQFYTLHDAILLPRPQRASGPPILIGGSGPQRTLPLVARYADVWNGQLMTAVEFRERSALLDELVQAAGRRPQDVRRTMTFVAICGHDTAEIERRLHWTRALAMFAALPVEELIDVLRRDVKAFVGTPDELVAHIQAYVAAGADEIVLQWGDMDDIEGLEVLAQEVLPQLGSLDRQSTHRT
jgi:alkanesulfonate monooxygenase SsuD/methylene tetrahydromethanopterin reductase-like flavin-dependent oxidoreductase (luciferase family)